MTQKTREQLEDMWLTHFEPKFPPNYTGDSDDERAMALLLDKMSEKLKEDKADNLEEIKNAVKKIEKKPGCAGQIGWAVLVFIGFIVIMNILYDY